MPAQCLTFVKNAKPINFSKYELIKKYWKKQEVHTHLMTEYPNKLIDRVSKFSDIIKPIINKNIKIPDRLKKMIDREKCSIKIKNSFNEFSDYLLSNFK